MVNSIDLYELLKSEIVCSKYPEIEIVPLVQKQGFFPICTGTIDGSMDLSKLKVMVVGQDFGTKTDFIKKKISEKGENIEKQSTWKNLIPMLKNLGIEPSDCFYTNLLFGLRDSVSNVGISPSIGNKDYIEHSNDFFEKQMDALKPNLIIFLGKVTFAINKGITDKKQIEKINYIKSIRELNKTKQEYKGINCLYMIHPSFRPQQLGKRFWSEEDEINYYKN